MLIHEKEILIAELVEQLTVPCASHEVKTNKACLTSWRFPTFQNTQNMSEENFLFKYFLYTFLFQCI